LLGGPLTAAPDAEESRFSGERILQNFSGFTAVKYRADGGRMVGRYVVHAWWRGEGETRSIEGFVKRNDAGEKISFQNLEELHSILTSLGENSARCNIIWAREDSDISDQLKRWDG